MKAQAEIMRDSGPYPWGLLVTCEDLRRGEPGKEERIVTLYSRYKLRKDAEAAVAGKKLRAEASLALLAGES